MGTVEQGETNMDERFILDTLLKIQQGVTDLTGEFRELKANQENLKDAWDKACVVTEMSDLKHLTKENSQRIDKLELRRQRPLVFIVGILSSVLSSVFTMLFGRYFK